MTLRVGSRSVVGQTRNLSRGGVCADVADPVPVGSDIDLDIVLVFEDDVQSEALRLPARVVWCTPLGDSHQVGVMFRALTEEHVEYLTMFLRFLDEGKVEKPNRRIANIDDRFR